MAADCSFFHSSTVFTMDCAPYCTADGAADRSFFLSSTAFTTVCAPYCLADGSGLLIPPLVNGFSDGSRAVLLSGRQRIANSSARQRLSRRFARRIAQRIAADCSYLRSSTAFTKVCSPYCSAAGTITRSWLHSFHPLVDDFANVAPAVDCSPYRSFFRLSTSYPTFCVLYCSTNGTTA